VIARDKVGEVYELIWTKIGNTLGNRQGIVGVKVLISGRKKAILVFSQNLDQGLSGGALSSDDV
jgi:hypothetical protein